MQVSTRLCSLQQILTKATVTVVLTGDMKKLKNPNNTHVYTYVNLHFQQQSSGMALTALQISLFSNWL